MCMISCLSTSLIYWCFFFSPLKTRCHLVHLTWAVRASSANGKADKPLRSEQRYFQGKAFCLCLYICACDRQQLAARRGEGSVGLYETTKMLRTSPNPADDVLERIIG